jgi:EmrB/QacA subfamily drug resistance transporter
MVNTAVPRKGLILLLTCLAQFMVVLDFAIVNVALPTIQTDFGMRDSALQWIVTAYGLLLGGFLLLGGRLGDLIGRRTVLLTGLVIFTAASLAAGLAQSGGFLIAMRGVQGFGAALIAPSALSILAISFAPGRERSTALGIFGAVGGSSASVGVIASGLLTDGPGWRWIFFINVPVGIALVAIAARHLPKDRGAEGSQKLDIGGALTVTTGLISLVYGLNRGVDHGWSASSTIAFFALAAVLLIGFVLIERRASHPLVPGSVLRNRTMVAADLGAFFLFGAFFSFVFLGTLMMQQLLTFSPTRTGVAWLSTSLVAFVLAGFTGARLVPAVGVKKLVVAGMIFLILSAAWLTRLPEGASFGPDVLPAFLLGGLAIGLTGPTLQIGALMHVADHEAGMASGIIETMREIGGAGGVAAVTTVLVSRNSGTLTDGFQHAFAVIVVLGVLGALVALFAFPNRVVPQRQEQPQPDQELLSVPTSAD